MDNSTIILMNIRQYKKDKIKGIDGRLGNKIHLTLSGFNQQTLIPTTSIVDSINCLPDSHLSGLKTIEYDPKRSNLLPHVITRLFHKSPPCCKGVFLQRKRKIVIYDFHSKPMFYHILFHEIGHFVYFLVLTPKLKKQWVTQMHLSDDHLTEIAAHNAAEDFAECYALYKTNKALLKQSPIKYAFIHQFIFECDIQNDNNRYFDGILIDKSF